MRLLKYVFHADMHFFAWIVFHLQQIGSNDFTNLNNITVAVKFKFYFPKSTKVKISLQNYIGEMLVTYAAPFSG